jgi:hypothetical protein
VHVTLRVEAAFPLTIVPKQNTKLNVNVKRFAIATTTEPVARVCIILSNKASNGDYTTGVLRAMTENETRLEQAIGRVAETKRLIAEQRQRIEKLRASGISTLDAEQTLNVLCSSVPSLEKYEKYVREQTLKNAN